MRVGVWVAATTTAPELADWLLAHGRTSVTSDDVATLLGVPVDHVRVRLQRQVHTGRVFSPARGLWVPIPPQFRTWGVVPAEHFVDDLMHHLEREYYVGWLSAAELHGVAHQRPQVFQVAVTSPVADRDIGRVRLRFVTRSALEALPRIRRPTPTGQVWVAAPELTALDLVDDPFNGGGISNVATVLAELAEEPGLKSADIAETGLRFPVAALRRLGYLLESVGAPVDLSLLRDHLATRPMRSPSVLSPGSNRRGERDPRWNVIVNTDVEPDL